MNNDTGASTWSQKMYDSKSEILEKISTGEDSTVEYKERLPKRDEIADEICAFANSAGGVILFGVTDTGDIIGGSKNEIDQWEKTVIEICRDSLEPACDIMTEKLILNEKRLLKIEIPRGIFVHKSPGGYFKRQGSSKREMPTEQLARLLQIRSQARVVAFDEQLVETADVSALNKNLYTRFIRGGSDEFEALSKRRLLCQGNEGPRASVAGILMCSDVPDRYLYNSLIQAVHYSGITKDANYQIDAKDFKASLDQQIIGAFKFVEKYNRVSATKNIGRTDKPQYSMKAVFEAIVNAVVHRDYSKSSSKVRLFMFSDRMELYSPGELANTLTVDTLAYNQATRNELLSRLLSETELDDDIGNCVDRRHFLERRGEGVGIIMKESEELSGYRPVYKMIGEELLLTIYAAPSTQKTELAPD